MTDDSSTAVDRFALLTTKIEREARFTRSLLVMCTMAIMGVMFYGITEIFKTLPLFIVANYMANLDKIVYQTKVIEMAMPRRAGVAPSPAPAPAPAPAKKAPTAHK